MVTAQAIPQTETYAEPGTEGSLLATISLPVLRMEKSLVDADKILRQAHAATDKLVIVDEDTLEICTESLSMMKRLEKILIERRKERTEPLKREAKAIEADFNKFILPVTAMKEKLDRRVIDYYQEQERRAAAARAEQERLVREAEEKRRAEEERIQREAQEMHAREVAEARAKGVAPPPEPLVVETAPELPEALTLPVPEARTTFRTTNGTVGIRKVWRAEVVDLKALCRGVADGNVPVQAVEANMTFLNKQAVAFEGEMHYPGVTCKHVASTASR